MEGIIGDLDVSEQDQNVDPSICGDLLEALERDNVSDVLKSTSKLIVFIEDKWEQTSFTRAVPQEFCARLKLIHEKYMVWMVRNVEILSKFPLERKKDEHEIDYDDSGSGEGGGEGGSLLASGETMPESPGEVPLMNPDGFYVLLDTCYLFCLRVAWCIGLGRAEEVWASLCSELGIPPDTSQARKMDATEFITFIQLCTSNLVPHDPKNVFISILAEIRVSQMLFLPESEVAMENKRRVSCIQRFMWWRLCAVRSLVYYQSLSGAGVIMNPPIGITNRLQREIADVRAVRSTLLRHMQSNSMGLMQLQMMNENIFAATVLAGEAEYNSYVNPWMSNIPVLLHYHKTTLSTNCALASVFVAHGPPFIFGFQDTTSTYVDAANSMTMDVDTKLLQVWKIIVCIYTIDAIMQTECGFKHFLSRFLFLDPELADIQGLRVGVALINREFFVISDYKAVDTQNQLDMFIYLLVNSLRVCGEKWAGSFLSFLKRGASREILKPTKRKKGVKGKERHPMQD